VQVRVHTEADAGLPDLARWSTEAGSRFEPGSRWESIAAGQPAAGSIDLLQGEFSPRAGRVPRVPRAAVAVALAIVAFQLAFTGFEAWRLARERDSLVARREALFRGAFPEAKVVVDPELQMARNLADLRRSRGLAGGDDFLVQMTRAARLAKAPARSIEYADGKLVTR